MRRPAMYILLLVIFCLWCHVQPTAGAKCTGIYAHACAGGNRKRGDIGDLAQSTDLGAEEERPDIQEAREGERRGDGGRDSDGFRGTREGDDLRSEFSDLRQLSEERQLSDIGNRRHNSRTAPLDPALDRLRSLLRTLDVDDREEKKEEEKKQVEEEKQEQRQEEEPPRLSSTDTNRRYIVKDTLSMLRRMLDDIEGRFDSQPVPDSVSKKRGYADDTENNYYSLQKRATDQ